MQGTSPGMQDVVAGMQDVVAGMPGRLLPLVERQAPRRQ